jgi:hypothetical protein
VVNAEDVTLLGKNKNTTTTTTTKIKLLSSEEVCLQVKAEKISICSCYITKMEEKLVK